MLAFPNDIFAILFSRLSLDEIGDMSYVDKNFLARINTFSSHVARIVIMCPPIKCAVAFLERTYPRHIIIGSDDTMYRPQVNIPDTIMHRANRLTVIDGFRLLTRHNTLKNITRMKLMNDRASIMYEVSSRKIQCGVKQLTCHNMKDSDIDAIIHNAPITKFKYYVDISARGPGRLWSPLLTNGEKILDQLTIVGEGFLESPFGIVVPFNGKCLTLVNCNILVGHFTFPHMHTLILHNTNFISHYDTPIIPVLRNVILSGMSIFDPRVLPLDRYNITAPNAAMLAKLARKSSRVVRLQ